MSITFKMSNEYAELEPPYEVTPAEYPNLSGFAKILNLNALRSKITLTKFHPSTKLNLTVNLK